LCVCVFVCVCVYVCVCVDMCVYVCVQYKGGHFGLAYKNYLCGCLYP